MRRELVSVDEVYNAVPDLYFRVLDTVWDTMDDEQWRQYEYDYTEILTPEEAFDL
jgi:hypothetical protein